MKPLSKFGSLSAFLFFSILLHIFIFLMLFWTERREPVDASWSGGLGEGASVTYVDLDDFFTPAKFSPTKSTSAQGPQKYFLKNKITHQKKSWGRGSSSTPAGGMGSGLDATGQVSTDPSVVMALIRKKIREKQRYPQIALDNDWTGTTKVGFQISEDGSLKFIKILHGSGYDILDEAAIKAVRNAVPLPYFSQSIAMSLEFKIE